MVVPLVAPIQFPVGRSPASIALNATAVFAEDDARKVLAPVDVMSERTPELAADRPRTDNPTEFGMLASAMLCAGTETVLETVRLLVETLVGVMAPSDRVMVPEVVTGLPETPMPLFPETPTDVTVPEPLVCQLVLVPSVCNTLPLWVACEGRKAFSAALAVVCPLPPLAIGNAVPE